MTKTYLMNGFVEKMQSPDQDFRYMGLSDLMKEIKIDSQAFLGDENVELKVLKQVLQLVEDKISEVKNQAVKCLGQLVKIIRESQMELVVDKLIDFSASKDEELREISGLALKTITSELPADALVTPKACAKLAPKLLGQLGNSQVSPETLMETLDILKILIIQFPSFVSVLPLNPPPVHVLTPLLLHPRPAVRKRAIVTLAEFVPYSSPDIASQLITAELNTNLSPSATAEKQRTTVQLIAALARTSPQRVASGVNTIVAGILKVVQRDDDELRDGSLQALEALVLKCPTEIAPFLPAIIQAANQYVKYDPNYAAVDDEDEEMADEEDEEDDAELDEYSDDEDTSYKIRRSATKLLGAIIATRPEILVALYKEVSSVLISRFGDREETVRLEVWATYTVLLNQTSVYGGGPQAKDSVGGKRKRTEDGMEVEETAYTLLQSQVPSLAKVLLNQIKSPKTAPGTLQAGFSLLHTLLKVLPGSLANHAPQVTSISKSILSQSPSTSTSVLHISCLQFLSLFFSTHPPATFTPSLPSLAPVLFSAVGERHPRVASEAFRALSSCLNALKPAKNQEWVDRIYAEALKRLSNHDTDAEVRACAEDAMADLWICATDIMKTKDQKEWDYICRSSGRTDGAVKVVSKVAKDVDLGAEWTNRSVEWTMSLLKKSGRVGKVDIFECMGTLLANYDGGVPADLPPVLVPQLKPYVSTADISLLAQAMSILAVLLETSPSITFQEIERDLLNDVYSVARSQLLSGAALDSVLAFFGALVEADSQIAAHVVPSLVKSVEGVPKNETSFPNVAKCVAQVVKSYQGVAAGVIIEYAKHIKKSSKATPPQVVLSLLILGEVGRSIDMAPQDIFNNVIDHLTAEQEEVRIAAAFAAGNIAIGNLHQFLPAIVKIVEGDDQKRLLALQALKEVVTHTSHGQLENMAETLWAPLFRLSENSDESTRNVAAACIGKLVTAQPARYLPQVHARLRDPSATTRATVLSSIRYTFADSSQAYDEVLAPHVLDFLSLMLDEDLNVRKLALSALNAAARTKPHLIRDHLSTLLPNLYKETVLKPELIRTVQMGPWQHKVDDGLEARKTAYETLYTLLDTCLTKIDLNDFLSHVLVGLADQSDEIKVICHMMLFRLAQIAPTAVAQHLIEATPLLEASMKGPNIGKDTVKQDLERAAELQRSTLRAIAALSKIAPPGSAPKFDALLAELSKTEWARDLKELSA